MKVLIVGAGAQGHVVTWNLARCSRRESRSSWATSTRRARAPSPHRLAAPRHGQSLSTRATSEALEAAAAGAKLVMNATIPEFNMTIIEACLAVGVDYQDMATGTLVDKTIDEATLMQMELDEAFREAGLTMLTCTGMDPGVSSTFAGNCYEDLDRLHRHSHQGLRGSRESRAAADVVGMDVLHRLRHAAAHLPERQVQARAAVRLARDLRVSRRRSGAAWSSRTTTRSSRRCRASCPGTSARKV